MNICLVRPPKLMKLLGGSMNPVPPLGLAFVAASLREAGHRVTVIDAIGEAPLQVVPYRLQGTYTNGLSYDEIYRRIPSNTDAVGFSMMFTENWLSDRDLIHYLGSRMPGVTFFAGGEHISAYPEMWLKQAEHLHVCVVGEGEETAVELARALESGTPLEDVHGIVFKNHRGTIITNLRRGRIRKIEDIPLPAWELFPIETYNDLKLQWGVYRGKSLPILATRGCPYTCTFCSSPQMWTTKYSMRSPMHVADEMEMYYRKYGITNFDFYDLTAIIRKEWIIDLSKEIIRRGLQITWQIPGGTRSEAINREVAHWLYRSGCRNITYAPESGSPETLHYIRKKISISKMLTSIGHSNREGMNIKLNIMIGFPEERHKHLWQTIWFLMRAAAYGAHDAVPSIFSPYPGSALFEQLVREGQIRPDTDEYYEGILDTNDYTGTKFYNKHLSKGWLRFYFYMYLVAFFGTQYLVRPWRLIRTLRNLVLRKQESRGEAALLEMLGRRKFVLRTEMTEVAHA
ncbi:MAG: B12-binding domain-containing radical SAM protein [Chitinophagales bacterium]|nr:B12-binding domain-containing radical SAM protein [Chitinophagales bacterium]MDW8417800.1 cobalamin-dependent protein [Chitinophagales bacterium]